MPWEPERPLDGLALPALGTPEGRQMERLASVLFAAIVAIAAVAVALIAVLVEAPPPSVSLADPYRTFDGWRVSVQSASPVRPYGEFAAELRTGNALEAWLDPVAVTAAPGAAITYTDANGNGFLDPPDYFTVRDCLNSGAVSYTFELRHSGEVRASETFTDFC